MSTHFGGRTLARSQALQLLFQAEANGRAVIEVLEGDYALSQGPLDDYARQLALGCDETRPDLDAIISMRSTTWSLSRMNAVDRNLLRLALYEMLNVDDVDVAVTIDECVELAKAYGTDESSRFVNGLLGRVADDLEAGVDVVAVAREDARRKAEERRAVEEAAAAEAAEAEDSEAPADATEAVDVAPDATEDVAPDAPAGTDLADGPEGTD